MMHNDHEVLVNDGGDTDVPGEGSDGGGHSAVRLAGLRRWTHTRLTAGTKKRKMSRHTRVGFGSPSERKLKLPRRKVHTHSLRGFQQYFS